MKKIIASMLFMAFAGSAFAATPIFTENHEKRLRELILKAGLNVDKPRCRGGVPNCFGMKSWDDYFEYKALRSLKFRAQPNWDGSNKF